MITVLVATAPVTGTAVAYAVDGPAVTSEHAEQASALADSVNSASLASTGATDPPTDGANDHDGGDDHDGNNDHDGNETKAPTTAGSSGNETHDTSTNETGNETRTRTAGTATGRTVYVGSDDGTLHAVDADTGTQEWTFTVPDSGVRSSPTVVDGTVYVGSFDGTVYAVDAETGTQQWAFEQPDRGVFSSPTVVDGTVYVGDNNETLFAIDADTGTLKWKFGVPTDRIPGSPTVANGTVYVGSDDSTLYAVDADTGNLVWTFDQPTEAIISSPTVYKNTVYVGSNDAKLYAVDADTGTLEWTFDEPTGDIFSSPTVVDGTVYVGSDDSTLYAIDADTGTQEWAFEQPTETIESSPTVVNGTVYVGSWDGTLYAVDADTGTQEWAFDQPAAEIISSPTVDEGTVYFGADIFDDEDSTLYAVDADTGNLVWTYDAPTEGVASSPTVVKNPASGDSVGSRVRLGTLGHHGGAAGGGLQVTVTQIIRPNFPEVTVYAEVKDANGSPISGLTASDFSLTEDGVSQSITSVKQVGSGGNRDISTALVVDRSGSMARDTNSDGTDRLADAKTAAKAFIAELQAGDEAAIISFNESTRIDQYWTSDQSVLNASVDTLEHEGYTAVWDATEVAINQTAPRQGRSAVIVLTDGKDNRSPQGVQHAIDVAKDAGVPVYTIGLGDSTDINEGDLRNLADSTGGDYYHAPQSSDLVSIYNTISQQISAEYRITYTTTNAATDGTVRTVDVTAFDGGTSGTGTGTYTAPCAPLPEAEFSFQPSTPTVGQQVTLDATASVANGGAIEHYYWDFNNDGQIDDKGVTATTTFSNPGTYEVRLTVEKGCGADDVLVKTVTVSGSDATISISDGSAAPGSTTTVSISTDATDVAGYQTTITYDPSLIQVVGVKSGDFAGLTTNVDNAAGTVTIADARSTGLDRPVLAQLVVKAVGSPSTATLSFDEPDTTLNGETTSIPIDTYDDGLITIQDCLAGDADQSGAVTTLDATLVLRYVVGKSVPSSFDAGCADYDNNNAVTSLDATLILREIAGLRTSTTATGSGVSDTGSGGTVNNANASGSVQFDVGSVSGSQGETTMVNITTRNAANLAGFRAELSFDPDVVSVESVTGVGLGSPTVNINNATGRVVIAAAQANGVSNPVVGRLNLSFVGSPGESTKLTLLPSGTRANNETTQLSVSIENGTASIASGSTGTPNASRTLSSSTVSKGGSVTVTLQTTATGSTLSFNEAFNPPVASATITSVTADGQSASTVLNNSTPNGAVVTLTGLSPGANVTVTYTIQIADNATVGSTYTISGDVTREKTETLANATFRVVQGSPLDGVAGTYDTNTDGKISIGELGDAAVDFASGQISITDLGRVAAVFAKS